MAEDQDPLDDDQDPNADTPDADAEDTDAAEPDPKSPEERQKEAQRTITRLSQENARLRREAEAAEPDDEPDAPATDTFAAKFETESWALAEATYGPEAIAAFEAAQKLGEPQSPADWVGTFEAYHQARLGKAPAKAGAKPKAADLEPREQDLDPDLQQLDKKLTEARKGGTLGDFAAAATARMGFGGPKS